MERGGKRGRWKKKRSKVWDYFTRYTRDNGKERSKCNRCGNNDYTYGHGTGTLWKHLKECGGSGEQGQESAHVAAGEQQPIIPSLPPEDDDDMQFYLPLLRQPCASMAMARGADVEAPSVLEEEEACKDLARMIALHGHHPSVVEDAHFKSFVRRLNPRFKLPSREDIEEVCHTVFAASHCSAYAPRTHSFAVGKAESMEALYITRNFIDAEWNLGRRVEHAYMLLPSGNNHDASGSSMLGVPIVSREGAAERALSYIQPRLYYPHMVAGEMTSELKRLIHQKLGSADTDTTILCTTSMDLVLHSIGHCLLPDPDHARAIFSVILDSFSSWTRQRRQGSLSELGLDDPLEFDEHWYWCYCALKMTDFQLTSFQTILYNLWGTIYSAIKRISASSTPTSHLCLEELLKVRDALYSQLSAPGLSLSHAQILKKALEIVVWTEKYDISLL